MTGKKVWLMLARAGMGPGLRIGLAIFLLMWFGAELSLNAQEVAVQAETPLSGRPESPADGAEAPAEKPESKDGKAETKKPLAPTEITSDALEYDFNKQVIVFAGNVLVMDDQLELRADKMSVFLDKKTQAVARIEATGNVEVKKEDGKATSREAEYDLVKGQIVLKGEPVIHSPSGLMKGALKVIYDRKLGQFKTEGGKPRLEIHDPNAGTAVDKFIKKPGEEDRSDAVPEAGVKPKTPAKEPAPGN